MASLPRGKSFDWLVFERQMVLATVASLLKVFSLSVGQSLAVSWSSDSSFLIGQWPVSRKVNGLITVAVSLSMRVLTGNYGRLPKTPIFTLRKATLVICHSPV